MSKRTITRIIFGAIILVLCFILLAFFLILSVFPSGDLYEFQERDEKIDAICSQLKIDARIISYGGEGSPLILEIENKMGRELEGLLVESTGKKPIDSSPGWMEYPNGSGSIELSKVKSQNLIQNISAYEIRRFEIDNPRTRPEGKILNDGDKVHITPIILITYDYTSGRVVNATGYGACGAQKKSLIVEIND